MPARKISSLLVLVFFAELCVAQISKGDRYYEKSEYLRAIPYYKKASRHNEVSRREALIKLGDSYRKVNDWANAENAYRQALEAGNNPPPEVYYNYAQALKVNNKYEEAAAQYKKYIALAPND